MRISDWSSYVCSSDLEAFEEELWMAFFGQLHDPHRSAVLDAETDCPECERFFRDHLRKLLWVRRRPRYLSKANYNVTRMARSEERRVGKESDSTCRSSWSPYH